VELDETQQQQLGQFLRALSGAFNLALVQQRLEAAAAILDEYPDYTDIAKGLARLAQAELRDARDVLSSEEGPPMYIQEQGQLGTTSVHLQVAVFTRNESTRRHNVGRALDYTRQVRAAIGAGIEFELGSGNLMY